MIAAIYARKSIATNKGESIENQIQLCKEIGIKAGATDFLYYKDEGFSGSNTNRPKFKEMMKDAKAKKFSMLICYRLDRISRNVADFSSTLETLHKYDIDFVSIKENFDTSTPIGRAMVYIASVFAQLERETIAERVRDNMLELAKTGRWLGGTAPLGFTSEAINYKDANGKNKKMYKLIPVPKEIEVVKLIFDLYINKKGFPSVATHLCSHHYKGKNGGEFSQGTVEQIIKNPVYTFADKKIYDYFKNLGAIVCGNFDGKNGVITYNKRQKGKKTNPINEWIISVGKHKGIIPSNLWIKCQNINALNNKKTSPRSGTGNKFLLSGLLICGECGSSMSSWSRNNPKSGKYERYYRCNLKNRASNRCSSTMLNADVAEDLVLKNIKGVTVDKLIESYDKILSEQKSKGSLIKKEELKLKTQIENNKKIIESLIRKLALLDDDPVIVSAFQKEFNNLNIQNISLKKDLLALKNLTLKADSKLNYINEITSKIENFKRLFDCLESTEKKRQYLLEIVSSIVWHSKKRILEVNLFNANSDAPMGGVRRRTTENLSFENTSR
ncbi:recombinase family protein [Clostridium botulinum]|uniref:recombinase family protein n=2 Tax=Clostridium botulinum TaxID=1491 RepID=UPI001A935FE7|nr:recombinase family protein [Clostridium botulinum]MBO0525760.1 recombinase family protein [Clostridium botulinum]MBO0528396.1 recombinase family protein [Clostridium botulinum]MBO0539682.1 recombinase family protein [Clostridium botulinum]MBO0575275.1 recombinase family protein [Clostridium botulinum]MBO0579583.1 recombinase family protein [Clostridium botulinum]